MRQLTLCLLIAFVSCWPLAAAAPQEPAAQAAPAEVSPEDKSDEEIGKSAAQEMEKQFKVVENPPEMPRIEAVIAQIRPVTEKPNQTYKAKVIASKAVNAFSLPGGYLYYTQGLLDALESEDELAAVSGHEMAHICLNHSRKLMGKDERYKKILGPVVLAAIIAEMSRPNYLPQSREQERQERDASHGIDPIAIAAVGSLVVQDALNHYGREAELEADHQAVRYLKESKRYNPVAMLTVAEGLARLEGGLPQVEMGILQTHPVGEERIEPIERQLQELGVPIERRRVTKSLVAEAQCLTQDGREIGELCLNDRVVFQPAVELDGLSPPARAQHSAEVFNALLLADLQLLEVMLVQEGDSARVAARGETILTIAPADAAFHSATVEALAGQAMEAIRFGFQEEKVKRAY